jgi:hypothetical protein
MTDRFDVLRQFPWPAVTAAGMASGIRWVMALVAVGAVTWLVLLLTQRSTERSARKTPGNIAKADL